MELSFEKNPLISKTIAVLRDKKTQPPEFRRQLFQLGRYLAYELAQKLPVEVKTVESPLGKAEYLEVGKDLVILGVLRAALPMTEGVFEIFPKAQIGFISASRGSMIDEKGKDFEIQNNYVKIPDCGGKIVLVVDPMLASASTMLTVIEEIKKQGPAKIVVMSAIGTDYGIGRIKSNYLDVDIYIGVIDPILDEHGYIVPGLGDAGDRAYNTEIPH